MRKETGFWILTIFMLAALLTSPMTLSASQIEIIRDYWGVAHVYADTDSELFFGAGYATAEDRMFQMELSRRKVSGKLSEIYGKDWLESDKLMRTLGLYKHAQEIANHLDGETKSILEAYAEGVNYYLETNLDNLNPVFDEIGIVPDPWTVADSIAVWMRLSERFDRSWQNEVTALRNYEQRLRSGVTQDPIVIDNSAAIVTESDFLRTDPDAYRRLMESEQHESSEWMEWDSLKASHAWTVSGSKTLTGSPLLESDPQIAVTLPSLWYEIHLSGGNYNVRGICVAGSPGFLIGWNEYLAWGATALGSDNGDLFQERLSEDRSEFLFKDVWYPVQSTTEVINVRDEEPVEITVSKTIHGPLVDSFLKGAGRAENFSLKYVAIDEMKTPITGMLSMMRSRNWEEFTGGLSDYMFPGIHVVYADVSGNIGYHTAAAIPIRSGRLGLPQIGWTGNEEWTGYLPFEDLPHVLNPSLGFVASANHLPVGDWYPYSLTIGTGGTGHNPRSMRLYELLDNQNEFTFESFSEIHRDNVSAIARDFLNLAGILLQRNLLSQSSSRLLNVFSDWDYRLVENSRAADIAETLVQTMHRSLRVDSSTATLASKYGGGHAGNIFLLRSVLSENEIYGMLTDEEELAVWVNQVIETATANIREDTSQVRPQVMVYQANLEGFPSILPNANRIMPSLTTTSANTIWSQLGNSYTQVVDLSNIDNSRAFLPPGISEDPRSPHFFDQVALWVAGETRPAPLSREEVMKYAELVRTLPSSVTEKSDKVGAE
ncbi:penicillin acylase family protein [Mesotoga sp.]|uniref:penicillin acylase family protein n=1 Tax=Mesotoga sp. TaxID=2053577 RepID=UPI001BD48435|nr:penicillin acylase family protein [Mesotoga sp.]